MSLIYASFATDSTKEQLTTQFDHLIRDQSAVDRLIDRLTDRLTELKIDRFLHNRPLTFT